MVVPDIGSWPVLASHLAGISHKCTGDVCIQCLCHTWPENYLVGLSGAGE